MTTDESINYLTASTVQGNAVSAWEETIYLPTYEVGEAEKYPMFLEKRVYQGSSGVVYPYPVIEKIADEKVSKPYIALFIENQYIKVMVLPELGGRIQMAYDKANKRHFVYYNQVIKPALVGLTGPWISGGIEFNWPQHHRPSTFLPTDYRIEEHEDGSMTLWCSEVERMFRTKGMQGFTLYPDKAYIEVKAAVYNRTAFPQTFLWWANPAIPAGEHYKSVFPPDVHAVFDHGKRDVSAFPIATGFYYKQDYTAGVDISRYKNIPVPTSYMAIKSDYDFIGGYDDNERAGLLHVANHHISPGKKQWTWGCGDFGKAWDRNLTDEDGPYIELMTGVYTDNQPDFAWLQPYEEKTWVQYFMPYTEVGYVKEATKDAAINLELVGEKAKLIIYTTAYHERLRIRLTAIDGTPLFDDVVSCGPATPLVQEIAVGGRQASELKLVVADDDGHTLITYTEQPMVEQATPAAATAPKRPEDVESVEQLYLIGLHLEQYRHATYNPLDYYFEALKREPGDVRSNNAVGLLLTRRGKFAAAERYFRTAIATLTRRNPNPQFGEPYYHLGWCLVLQGKVDEAYGAYYKAIWNEAWRAPGYYALTLLDVRKGDWASALEHVEQSLVNNWHHHKARQLKASILRKMGRVKKAMRWIDESLEIDRFNVGCLFEKYLLTGDNTVLGEMKVGFRRSAHDCIEYALDFASAGLYEEAQQLLETLGDDIGAYPMTYYTLGYIAAKIGRNERADELFAYARGVSADWCFPNRIEEVEILETAVKYFPEDAKAYYYLGNFWYANRQYDEAIIAWERSAALDRSFPIVLRNLAIAHYNKRNNKQKAVELMEAAFACDESDARLLMELDQLYKKMNQPHEERYKRLAKYRNLVDQRDDLYVEWVTLHNQLGRYAQAKDLIDNRKFHPWEGGEGKITRQYLRCRLELARQAIAAEDFAGALELLNETDAFPENLSEGKLATVVENDIHYFKGVAYRGLGEAALADEYFQQATHGAAEPVQAFFYNDPQPDQFFFSGMAWRALGDEQRAQSYFRQLIEHGQTHLDDDCRIDYFAVSLPDLAIWEEDLNVRNKAHCYYVMALGYAGLNEQENALEYYNAAKAADLNKQLVSWG
ncbi:tetratricopeptide repeat protein [Parapedobacter soli]|uniref:tetratricopeptide repeat protein n=1 Tax=Parapedobacter soli TaxID=416955 RepID=UPI0021C9C770|nr:DUF5107 domain-containing protein [Parapedobacter soli]